LRKRTVGAGVAAVAVAGSVSVVPLPRPRVHSPVRRLVTTECNQRSKLRPREHPLVSQRR
jgi:hypothetical protein